LGFGVTASHRKTGGRARRDRFPRFEDEGQIAAPLLLSDVNVTEKPIGLSHYSRAYPHRRRAAASFLHSAWRNPEISPSRLAWYA